MDIYVLYIPLNRLKGIQRIYKHDAAQSLPRSADQVHIYMIRSVLGTFQTLLKQLQPVASEEMPDISMKMYHIVCVPSCYSYFQTLLEQAGLYGLVQLHHFNWDFIYFDQGVLSLELPNVSRCTLNIQKRVFYTGYSYYSALRVSLPAEEHISIACGGPEPAIASDDLRTTVFDSELWPPLVAANANGEDSWQTSGAHKSSRLWRLAGHRSG